MKLELIDAEIKQAVADYVSKTIGINLETNDLKIAFSATRHEGLIAKLETTPKAQSKQTVASAPAVIPGFSDTTAVDAPALAEPVADPADVAAQAPEVPEIAAEVSAEPEQEIAAPDESPIAVEAAPEAPIAEVPVDAPKKATATLFGKPAATNAA